MFRMNTYKKQGEGGTAILFFSYPLLTTHYLLSVARPLRNVDTARTSNYHCCKRKVPGPWMKPQN
jgi:hypothetical protein